MKQSPSSDVETRMANQFARRLVAVLVTGAAAAALGSGCAAPTEDPTDEAVPEGQQGEETATSESALDSSGRTCAGWCYTNVMNYPACGWTAGMLYYTYRPNVTQDCRARIVDFCHNRGWGFGDAYWTYRRFEGYVCRGQPI